MVACAHCGQAIHEGEETPELCDNCAKPEALAAWEADHARPDEDEPKKAKK